VLAGRIRLLTNEDSQLKTVSGAGAARSDASYAGASGVSILLLPLGARYFASDENPKKEIERPDYVAMAKEINVQVSLWQRGM